MPQHLLTYLERSRLATHPLARSLFKLMEEKKSNLCAAADVTSSRELLQLAREIGPSIAVLKTHIDLLLDFSSSVSEELLEIASEKRFLLFEDRKFADIGNTAALQYGGGIYKIADWAALTNAHPIPGPGIIEALASVGKKRGRGLLLLAEMSSKGTLASGSYTDRAVEMAESYRDFVIGFIATRRLTADPGLLHFMPGIQISRTEDRFGQRYLTPEEALCKRGADLLIVGRGIYQADNPQKSAEEYRELGWRAYSSLLAAAL